MGSSATDLCCFDHFGNSPYHCVEFMNGGSCHEPLANLDERDIRNLSCTSHTSSMVVFGCGTCKYELDIVSYNLIL